MKKRIYIVLISFLLFNLLVPIKAAVTSVTVTAASRSSVGGSDYYLAGETYTFRVQAASDWVNAKSGWNEITLQIRNAANAAICSVTVSVDTDTSTAITGLILNSVTDNSNHGAGSLDYDITVTFLWTATEIALENSDVRAVVSDDSGGANSSDIYDPAGNFGICSSIKVLNFMQDGNAGDGKVNLLHDPFNVTGLLVYNVASATALDTVPAGEITSTALLLNSVAGQTNITNNSVNANISFLIADDFFNTTAPAVGRGNYTTGWQVRAVFNTGAATEDSNNDLDIRCDSVRIDNITFSGGGGIDADPNYWKNVNVPGVLVRVYASMETGVAGVDNVEANTTVRIRYNYNDGNGDRDLDVTIASGSTWGEALLNFYPNIAAGNSLDTASYTTSFRAEEIINGPYDETVGGNGQHVFTDITQDATPPSVYWDNTDPPGNNAAAFTTNPTNSTTPDSFTINWDQLTAAGPNFDGDFYTYRIYFREEGTTPWNMVDRTTANYGPAQTWDLSDITTTSASIDGLISYTNYEYRLSAVDVFGNEVDCGVCGPLISDYGNQITGTVSTKPSIVEVIISDGVSKYIDTSFTNNAAASARPMRKSAIKVTINIVGGNTPDTVNLILEDDALEPANINTATPTYTPILCSKVFPNTWIGYIPSDHALINVGTSTRFIIEMINDSIPDYVDHDADTDPGEQSPAGENYNDYEWTFSITSEPNVRPWPVRILNNVITKKNPVAYPSYYLTDNAYVTIKIYDIKGRPVATLIEDAYRKGGQNIKDQGWRGKNKAQRKCGVGLYYMHFYAERSSDKKVILNKFKKVVIAK